MDWSFAKSLSDEEKMRLWVEQWKITGPELERMKKEELRAMTEGEAFEIAKRLSCYESEDIWIDPVRRKSAGLIEQQRIFSRLRTDAS